MVLIALLACIKHLPPAVDGGGRAVSVVAVVDAVGDAPTADAPESLDKAIAAALSARKLMPTVLSPEQWQAALGPARSSEQREAALAAFSPSLPNVLVELAPAFYSELSGQYRWTVGVKLSLAIPDSNTFDAAFSVPVFLRYAHEGESEAVAAAAPVISRRLGEMADIWLAQSGLAQSGLAGPLPSLPQ